MKRSVEATVLAGLFLAFLTGAFAWDVGISGTGTFSADFARAVA